MKITRLQVAHITNPLGFDLGGRPTFSWVVEDAVGTQAEASRVIVRRNDKTVADTGWTDLDAKACPIDLSFEPRTRYEWQVSVLTDADEETTSERAWFETAKLDEPWEAQWLTCDYAEPRHPVFFTELGLCDKPVASARLYACGLGLYDARIDGKPVSVERLAPGTHAFDQWLQYQTYDVTDQVRDGAELSFELGHGWYSGRFGFVLSGEGYYGNDWRLIAELRVRYADGSEQVIGTDDRWQLRRSQVTFSNIYDGERVDETLPELPIVSATLLATDEAVAATAKLHARLSLPVVTHESFVPELIRTPAGELVYDLGQNIAGTFRLWLGEVDRGTRLILQFGELLQDGNFYRDNLRTAQARYECVLAGPRSYHEARFTFFGYRYVKVEGVREQDVERFVGIALYSDFDSNRGRIETGSPKVNQLVSNARWGMRDNFLDTATDCPQRDERMGWTGDANVFSGTALRLAAPYAFYRKYLFDMALEQAAAGGMMPQVVPSYGLKGAPAVWGDATTFIPWNMYQVDGDPAILAEHYEAMKGYVDWVVALDGDKHRLLHVPQFGDWLALDTHDPSGFRGGTDEGFIAYVYLWLSAGIVARTAQLLGKDEDEAHYAELEQRVLNWIMHEYYTGSGRCGVNTQTAYVLSVVHGLGNSAWNASQLRKLLQYNGGKLNTGFVGTPLLCPALSESGMDREAYDLLLNEDYPGWLYCVNLGATTIWERWNSLDAEGHITGTEMNSMNHYSYGAVVEWLASYGAGLQTIDPGFARARIAPHVDWRLGSIDYTFDSASGTWRVAWECVSDQQIRVSLVVPFGAEAEVFLPLAPDDAYEAMGGRVLGPGSYEVTYEATGQLRRVPNVDWTMEQLANAPEVELVVRPFVDGYDYVMATCDKSKTLRQLQAEGLGQNIKTTPEQLEACDCAMRELADKR